MNCATGDVINVVAAGFSGFKILWSELNSTQMDGNIYFGKHMNGLQSVCLVCNSCASMSGVNRISKNVQLIARIWIWIISMENAPSVIRPEHTRTTNASNRLNFGQFSMMRVQRTLAPENLTLSAGGGGNIIHIFFALFSCKFSFETNNTENMDSASFAIGRFDHICQKELEKTSRECPRG